MRLFIFEAERCAAGVGTGCGEFTSRPALFAIPTPVLRLVRYFAACAIIGCPSRPEFRALECALTPAEPTPRLVPIYSKRRTFAMTPAEPMPPSSFDHGLARTSPGGGVDPERGGVCVRRCDAMRDVRADLLIQITDVPRLGGLFFGNSYGVVAVDGRAVDVADHEARLCEGSACIDGGAAGVHPGRARYSSP